MDYHIECTISLKDKFVELYAVNYSNSKECEQDIFPIGQITSLKQPISKPFIPYEKKDMVICLCKQHIHLNSLMKHLNNRAIDCEGFLTDSESNLLKKKITQYRKKVQ